LIVVVIFVIAVRILLLHRLYARINYFPLGVFVLSAVFCIGLLSFELVTGKFKAPDQRCFDRGYPLVACIGFYLLLVVAFAGAYLAASNLGHQIASDKGECARTFGIMLYFSILTASIGCGDFSAVGYARALVCIEAVMFWYYVAVAGTMLNQAGSDRIEPPELPSVPQDMQSPSAPHYLVDKSLD
jgi:hypothetical protein